MDTLHGYEVEPATEKNSKFARYVLRGKRGAVYELWANARNPHSLFVVNARRNRYNVPDVLNHWFTDEGGTLRRSE